MGGESNFLVEDFLNAIASQLDRVQDALRMKAVNRPLTYALKDLSLDLQVFVEMDNNGKVRLRSSGPNEAGASTIHIGFTTITKPMIEENTMSMAMTQSPGLDEIGIQPEEQKQLEKYGVYNAAQLHKLGASTGQTTLSRLSGIPVNRLRAALAMSQPAVHQFMPSDSPHPAPHPQQGARPPQGQPIGNNSVLRVAPNTSFLHMHGRNLIGESGPPAFRLNNMPMSLAHADHDKVVIALPEYAQSGALEVDLPNGETVSYHLQIGQHSPQHGMRDQGRAQPYGQPGDYPPPGAYPEPAAGYAPGPTNGHAAQPNGYAQPPGGLGGNDPWSPPRGY